MSSKDLFLITCILCFCTSCTNIDTIDLPDLDAKSFSTEQVIKKQKNLRKKRDHVRKLNQTETTNESR